MSGLSKVIASRGIVRGQITKLANRLDSALLATLTELNIKVYLKRLAKWSVEMDSYDVLVIDAALDEDNPNLDDITALKEENEEYGDKILIMTTELETQLLSLSAAVPLNQTLGNAKNVTGTRLKLPPVDLPEFHGDEAEDKLPCSIFFDQLESQLNSYNLDQAGKFSVLKTKLKGKALSMVESLARVKKSYIEAKRLLLDTFNQIVPGQFRAIKNLLNVQMTHGDSVTYFADLRKAFVDLDELKIDLQIIKQYIAWNGMSRPMQECLVQITGETFPNCQQIEDKYMQASNRFEASKIPKKSTKVEVTSQAVALKTPNKNSKTTPKQGNKPKSASLNCRVCRTMDHPTWACPKFCTAKDKIQELNRLNLCTRCVGNNHSSNECSYTFYKKCYYCNDSHYSWLCTKCQNRNNSGKTKSKQSNNSQGSSNVSSNTDSGSADSSGPLVKD